MQNLSLDYRKSLYKNCFKHRTNDNTIIDIYRIDWQVGHGHPTVPAAAARSSASRSPHLRPQRGPRLR